MSRGQLMTAANLCREAVVSTTLNGCRGYIIGSSEERGAFSQNATKTWVNRGRSSVGLPSSASTVSSLVPYNPQ